MSKNFHQERFLQRLSFYPHLHSLLSIVHSLLEAYLKAQDQLRFEINNFFHCKYKIDQTRIRLFPAERNDYFSQDNIENSQVLDNNSRNYIRSNSRKPAHWQSK